MEKSSHSSRDCSGLSLASKIDMQLLFECHVGAVMSAIMEFFWEVSNSERERRSGWGEGFLGGEWSVVE